MAKDETEDARRAQQARINAAAAKMTPEELRHALEAVHGVGNVWNREELERDFRVIGFMAPYIVVERKSDRKKGSIAFAHSPEMYFGWEEAI